jgi:hypothetical protein
MPTHKHKLTTTTHKCTVACLSTTVLLYHYCNKQQIMITFNKSDSPSRRNPLKLRADHWCPAVTLVSTGTALPSVLALTRPLTPVGTPAVIMLLALGEPCSLTLSRLFCTSNLPSFNLMVWSTAFITENSSRRFSVSSRLLLL